MKKMDFLKIIAFFALGLSVLVTTLHLENVASKKANEQFREAALKGWHHEIRGLNKYLELEGWLYMVDTKIVEELDKKHREVVAPSVSYKLQRSTQEVKENV